MGIIPTRIAYTLIFEDGTSEKFIESAFNWENSDTVIFNHSYDKKLKMVKLGDALIPDVNQKNDLFKVN